MKSIIYMVRKGNGKNTQAWIHSIAFQWSIWVAQFFTSSNPHQSLMFQIWKRTLASGKGDEWVHNLFRWFRVLTQVLCVLVERHDEFLRAVWELSVSNAHPMTFQIWQLTVYPKCWALVWPVIARHPKVLTAKTRCQRCCWPSQHLQSWARFHPSYHQWASTSCSCWE